MFHFFFPLVSLRSNPAFKEIAQNEVENVIKRWLRNASDRNGGRMKRMKKSLEAEAN